MITNRNIDTVRASIGTLDLTLTRYIGYAELGHRPDNGEAIILRILGARQVAQTVLSRVPLLRKAGIGVDVLHGLSMIALAWRGPARYRRAALTQLALATAFTTASLAAGQHPH